MRAVLELQQDEELTERTERLAVRTNLNLATHTHARDTRDNRSSVKKTKKPPEARACVPEVRGGGQGGRGGGGWGGCRVGVGMCGEDAGDGAACASRGHSIRLLTYPHALSRMRTYANVCWRMMAYADVC